MVINNKYLLIVIGVILIFGIYLGSQWKASNDMNNILEAEKQVLMLKVAESDKKIASHDSMMTVNSKYIYEVNKELIKLRRSDEKVKASADTIHVFSTHVSAIADSIEHLYR